MPGAVSGSVNNSSYEEKDWLNRFQQQRCFHGKTILIEALWNIAPHTHTHSLVNWLPTLRAVFSFRAEVCYRFCSERGNILRNANSVDHVTTRKKTPILCLYLFKWRKLTNTEVRRVCGLKWSWHSTESLNISTQHIPSWEANISSAREGISGIYGTWRFTTEFRTARLTCTCPKSD